MGYLRRTSFLLISALLLPVSALPLDLNWSNDVRLTFTPSVIEGYPSVTENNGNIYILNSYGLATGLFTSKKYSKFDKNGNFIFSDQIQIPRLHGKATTAIDSLNNIHISFQVNQDISYLKIDQYGNQEYTTPLVSNPRFTDIPLMLCDSQNSLHLIYQDDSNDPIIGDGNKRRDLYYKKFKITNNELIEEVSTRELTVADGLGYPNVGFVNSLNSVALDAKGNIHIVWADWRDYSSYSKNEIYYMKIDNSGNTIINETRVTDVDNYNSTLPVINVGENQEIYITWIDYRDGAASLFFKKFNSDGVQQNGDTKISTNYSPKAFYSAIDSHDNLHFLVSGLGNKYLVSYIAIDKNGEKLKDELVSELSGNNPYWYNSPIVVDYNDRVHLTWLDNRDGNWEVYYKYADLKYADAPDQVKPIITLLGDQTVTIEAGTNYTDSGATAEDNKDGDITSAIVTDNPVDTSKIGDYIITYNVKDSAGNAAEPVTRRVQVVDTIPPAIQISADKNILWPPNRKMVKVKLDGLASDSGSGVASVKVYVLDEYGKIKPILPGFGVVSLQAWRGGKDMDGRKYSICAVARDNAGNETTAITEVLVPHDMRQKPSSDLKKAQSSATAKKKK